MDIQIITKFFMWCTVFNGGLLFFWTIMCILAPDTVYDLQKRFFPIPRKTFDVVIYCFLGLFKIFFLFFNLVPYVVFLLIS